MSLNSTSLDNFKLECIFCTHTNNFSCCAVALQVGIYNLKITFGNFPFLSRVIKSTVIPIPIYECMSINIGIVKGQL